MKKKLLILLIIILCSSNNKFCNNKIEAKITNSSIKDSCEVEIELSNNTSKNYFLQIDISKLREPIRFFRSEYLHNADLKLLDSNKQQVDYRIVDYECYNNDNEKLYKASRSVKNVLKLKSGEKKIFKMQFLLKNEINGYCMYEYPIENFIKKNKYFVVFQYKMYSETDKEILSKSVKDSLKEAGFEFYDKEIMSNSIPFMIR